ncbi:hypothetical protein HK405_001631 [Cladochytrium tenue]|nr:hypothetical protein HK405_001631 [Cladochytrium tenue]
MKVLIIGGGVAGPALALALTRSGHAVEIFDRVVPPSPAAGAEWVPADIGGAILVNENVLRVFKALGVLDEIMAAGTQVVRHELTKFDGRPFALFPTFDGREFATTGVLRSAIARIINAHLNKAGVFIKSNKRLVAIDQPTDGSLGVTARFEDGTEARGDILVGADGINSTVRSFLFPEVKVNRSQYSGYFAVSPLNGKPTPNIFTVMIDIMTGNYAFVMPSGPTMIHWGMFESRPEVNSNDSWDLGADLVVERDRMLAISEKWNLPANFRELVGATSRVIRVNFSSVGPMPEWHKHNCVLIGDSAHSMLPFIGQGAGMSLEDALSLSMLLNALPTQPNKAIALLHELRAPRVDKVCASSEALANRTSGTSPTTAAIGHFVMKLFSYAARLFGLSYFSNEIIRYDVNEATKKFIASKGLGSA